MSNFIRAHTYSFLGLIVILIITITSGYIAFLSQTPIEIFQESSPTEKIENATTYISASRAKPITQSAALQKEKSEENTVQRVELTGEARKVLPEGQVLTSATLIIGDKSYSLGIAPQSSVYDMMKKLSEEADFRFNGKEYAGLGFFVEEINGLRNNEDSRGNYWIYYINGKKAEAGISNYIVKAGDEILWKYEAME